MIYTVVFCVAGKLPKFHFRSYLLILKTELWFHRMRFLRSLVTIEISPLFQPKTSANKQNGWSFINSRHTNTLIIHIKDGTYPAKLCHRCQDTWQWNHNYPMYIHNIRPSFYLERIEISFRNWVQICKVTGKCWNGAVVHIFRFLKLNNRIVCFMKQRRRFLPTMLWSNEYGCKK